MTELQPLQPPPEPQEPQQTPREPPQQQVQTPPALPPHLTLSPITTPNQLSQLRRINTLLLPIPYPATFYASLSSPTSLALIASYQPPSPASSPPLVVGGICCRLEESPPSQNDRAPPANPRSRSLYILTLGILAPYRHLGLASHLLEEILQRVRAEEKGVADVYAHVWEENEEARRWYKGRGFWEECGRVEGYYRRLKPSGAVVVRREVGKGCD